MTFLASIEEKFPFPTVIVPKLPPSDYVIIQENAILAYVLPKFQF